MPTEDSRADRLLGLILEAIVAAFESDPTEPLHLAPMDQTDCVSHPHWPMQSNAVTRHDLDRLEELGLISTRQYDLDLDFWPTVRARAAMKDVEGFLARLADEAPDEIQRSRFARWAERVRAGDVAVSAAGGTASGMLIRALMGF